LDQLQAARALRPAARKKIVLGSGTVAILLKAKGLLGIWGFETPQVWESDCWVGEKSLSAVRRDWGSMAASMAHLSLGLMGRESSK